MALYEIITREIWSRKKLAMVTLRELAPVTHEVLQEPAMLAPGTVLTDCVRQKWKVVEKRGAFLILKGKPGFLPSRDYLET
jgi:hypothetical protein